MKKFLAIASVFFLLTATAFAQSKSNDQIQKQIKSLKVEKNFTVSYDPSGGTSKIAAFGEDFGREADRRANVQAFSFGIAFFYPGQALTAAPAEINMTFWAQTKKPQFAADHHLTITAGGETLDLGDARYVYKAGEKTEYLNFKIPRETYAKIAAAADGKIKIGAAEFKFTPEHLKTFAALVKISDPSDL